MKKYIIIIKFNLIVFLVLTANAQNAKLNGNSSTLELGEKLAERLFFEEINKVRTDPKSYIPIVRAFASSTRDSNARNIILKELIPFLDTVTPVKPLVYSQEIRKAMDTHDGVDFSRHAVVRHSHNLNYGENIAGGSNASPIAGYVIILLADTYVPGRGHRENIMNSHYKYTAVRVIVFGDLKNRFTPTYIIQDFNL